MEPKISRRSFGCMLAGVAVASGGIGMDGVSLKEAHSAMLESAARNPRRIISLAKEGWQLVGLPPCEGEKVDIQAQVPRGIKMMPTPVPNDVQLSAGVSDPYGQGAELWRANAKEWWYLRTFPSPVVGSTQQVRLHFEGVDYFSDVWLNGQKLGSHEGAYTQFSFDITPLLIRGGSNYLAVRVRAPWKMPGRSHFEYMKGEFDSAWDALPGPGQVVFPLGLHRVVRLEMTGPARIEELQVSTVRLEQHKARLAVRAVLSNVGSARSVQLGLSVVSENFSGSRFNLPAHTLTFSGLSEELKEVYLEVELPNPRLWWTWDQGPQNLYALEARVFDKKGTALDSLSVNFGIRTLERDARLQYKLNGRPLLIRGAWYPMSKLYPAETDPWTYEKDLLLAKHANMNHLLNYTVVEKREFYELADRLGILLFIELPFNQEGPLEVLNKDYSRRAEYIQWSAQQVAEIVRDLSNHPSIGVWSALSEVTGNGCDFSTSSDPRIAAAAGGYRAFSDKMEETVLKNDRDAIYHKGYCDFGEHHFWQGSLFKGTTYDQQFDAEANFVSEYGALAYFPMESIQRILDPEKMWNDNFTKWSQLKLPADQQKLSYVTGYSYQGLEFLIPDVADNVDLHPQSFQNFVNDSQVYQAFLYGYAGDAYRRKLFTPIHGIRSWMFKNFPLKPVSGFGVIDCFNTPMMAYYTQRRTYAPVTMSFAVRYALESIPAGCSWKAPVWVSNARNTGLSLLVKSTLYSLQGEKLRERDEEVSIGVNRAQLVYELDWEMPTQPGVYLLRGSALNGDQSIATNEMYLKVVPSPTRKRLRVLVLGTADWAQPVIDYLRNLGAEVTPVLHKSGSALKAEGRFPDTPEDLQRHHDVMWLTGFDSYWREAPQNWAPTIVQAVEAGVAFVHTGSWASFHGGEDDRTAALDLTPLARILPVAVKHENDVWDGQFSGLSNGVTSSSHEPQIVVSSGAPGWIKQADFEGLYPAHYHLLEPRPGATTLLSMDDHPLLVTGHYGKGRTIAYLGFSPGQGPERPAIIDRAIRSSQEGRLFATISAAVLTLAGGEAPAVSVEELLQARTAPIFETLRNASSGAWPALTLAWVEKDTQKAAARVQIKNGPAYLRGFRVRFEGPDFADGSVLPLWTDQFFDLLPDEETECRVDLRWRGGQAPRKFSIVAEALNNPGSNTYEVPPL